MTSIPRLIPTRFNTLHTHVQHILQIIFRALAFGHRTATCVAAAERPARGGRQAFAQACMRATFAWRLQHAYCDASGLLACWRD